MIFLPILRGNLSSFSASARGASAPWSDRNRHFLMNFNDFPPHTEGQLKLIFCEFARWLAPQDPQNPSFS